MSWVIIIVKMKMCLFSNLRRLKEKSDELHFERDRTVCFVLIIISRQKERKIKVIEKCREKCREKMRRGNWGGDGKEERK